MASEARPRKVFKSAACIIPPRTVWEAIQRIREKHDKAFQRWMPHINLCVGAATRRVWVGHMTCAVAAAAAAAAAARPSLFPFVPDTQFEEAERLAAAAVGRVPAFRVRLAEFCVFSHSKQGVVWCVAPRGAVLAGRVITRVPPRRLRPEVLDTARPRAVHDVQAALEAAFPHCSDLSQRSDAGFTPHLTVGQWPKVRGRRRHPPRGCLRCLGRAVLP